MNIQIPNFDKAKILIVGDVMLDRYWHGVTSRISPEAPVPVVHVNQMQEYPGGAGNVALNIASLGARAALIGAIGDDEAGQQVDKLLQSANVMSHLVIYPKHPTITKLRILSRHQQLLRIDFEETKVPYDVSQTLKIFKQQLKGVNAVLLSDYGKGVLENIEQLIAVAREKNIPVFIDPKNKDFSRYKGATLLTPNLKEFREAVGDCETDEEIATKGLALLKKYDLEAILVTRSEKGMTLLQHNKEPLHLPTQAREVFDVTGAGDTVISVLTAAFASGQSLERATALANLAAGLVVAKLGAQSVTVTELRHAMHESHISSEGVVNEQQLLELRKIAKTKGETVVMTNGCFDLIHAGHIDYLEQAKALGDYLIVAVNDDESVKRLKGDSRPIMSLEQRMAVLAGLKSVDYVVSFSEDTPEKLISKILPDLLVKGGDYKPEDVAGGKAVIKNGGEVKILGFQEGCSTTGLINKIKQGK